MFDSFQIYSVGPFIHSCV